MSTQSEAMKDVYVDLDDVYLRSIKDRVDSAWKFQRQLERCAILRGRIAEDPEAYYAAVRELLSDLPLRVVLAVKARESEYMVTPEPRLEYKYYCGVPLELKDEKGEPISPVLVQDTPYCDYEKLHDIIKEESDRYNLRWEYRLALKEEGRNAKLLPKKVEEDIVEAIRNVVIEHRKRGIMYSYSDILETLRKTTPELPTPPLEEETVDHVHNT